MALFSKLKTSQKAVVLTIGGTCATIFMLNSASKDLEVRRTKAAIEMIQSRRVSEHYFQVRNDSVVIPLEAREAHPSFALSPFREDVWNQKFINNNLVSSIKNLYEGRWYTLITSSFTHNDTAHLAFNMFAFISVAPLILFAHGTPAFLTIWGVSGLSASFASLVNANIKMQKAVQKEPQDKNEARRYFSMRHLGASGSILGLFAASAVLYPQTQWQFFFIPYGIAARTMLQFMMGGSIIAGGMNILPSIGHWGHIGGMVSGIIIGLVLKNKSSVGRVASIAALTCSGVTYHSYERRKAIGSET